MNKYNIFYNLQDIKIERKGNRCRKFVNQKPGPSITALLLEVLTGSSCSPLCAVHKLNCWCPYGHRLPGEFTE